MYVNTKICDENSADKRIADLTPKEAIKLFRAHWNFLSKTGLGTKQKGDFLRQNGYKGVLYSCVLCEYTKGKGDNCKCDNCLIAWPQVSFRKSVLPCVRSYYGKWESAITVEERKYLAAIIRDLPKRNIKGAKRR